MIRALLEHLGWKIFSLVLAFALWVTFVGRPELARTISAPIEYQNMPSGLEVSSDVPERVQLEIRGSATRLDSTDLSGAAVVLNLASVRGPGEQTFTITHQNVRLPFGVRFTRAIPAQIRIEFQPQITREVPVKVRYSHGPPEGYRVQSQEVEPPKLSIIGPENEVKAVQFAETDPVDLSGTVSEAEFRVHAFLANPQVRFASSPIVRVKVTLEKKQQN